jgi:hypothetical protein
MSIEQKLLEARDAWMCVMSEYQDRRGLVCPPTPPMLEDRHLANCQLVASRTSIIRRVPKLGRVAELGVLAGDFSQVLLAECAPRELHLIDLDLHSCAIQQRFAAEVRKGMIMLHEGDSSQTLMTFADHSFDLIYIDADHTYEGVCKDLQVAKQKIRPEGLLILNDYTYWSPVECMPYGVMRAVNEFCLREDWEIAYFSLDPYMYCDAAIRPRR